MSALASRERVAPMLRARSSGLDPRTKIVLVVGVSALVMSPGGLPFVPAALLLGIGLAGWERAWGRIVGIVVAAAIMGVLGWWAPLWWPGAVTTILSIACLYLVRFLAAIGLGMHVVATTSPTQLSAALRAWRVPRAISVTLSVMIRFFPVVMGEAMAVLDAMRLRGLTGVRGMVRHPILSLERFAVPMIASSLRASEDLSASAILRGLGGHRRPTAMVPPRFGVADLALVLVVAALGAATMLLTGWSW